jgi:nitroimidazol reductase NimA-like FMN-containing flavoprotein (pyridoxamine 5'-phosphate oxidase superfamily)
MSKNYSLDVTPPNEQRIPEYVRDDDWTRSFLHQARIGHFATHWEGQPFITPSTFWFDEERNEIIFHSNIVGRVRANIEHHELICFEASENGDFLPSNVALEFSVQHAGVIVFGRAHVIEENEAKRRALYGLISKYFQGMEAGKEYRPITDKELARTSVYAIKIESWSGKKNWSEHADQSDEWPALGRSKSGNG